MRGRWKVWQEKKVVFFFFSFLLTLRSLVSCIPTGHVLRHLVSCIRPRWPEQRPCGRRRRTRAQETAPRRGGVTSLGFSFFFSLLLLSSSSSTFQKLELCNQGKWSQLLKRSWRFQGQVHHFLRCHWTELALRAVAFCLKLLLDWGTNRPTLDPGHF